MSIGIRSGQTGTVVLTPLSSQAGAVVNALAAGAKLDIVLTNVKGAATGLLVFGLALVPTATNKGLVISSASVTAAGQVTVTIVNATSGAITTAEAPTFKGMFYDPAALGG